MAKKLKKYLDLTTYELLYDEENLFNDEYGNNHRDDRLIYKDMEVLKKRTFHDKLKLGRNILELLGNEPTCKKLNEIISKTGVPIKTSQAIKYIEVYIFANDKFQKNQSTENLEELGIEKAYLLTTVKDWRKQKKLEKFIIDKDMSVNEFRQFVEILNNENKIFNLAVSFLSEFEKSNNEANPVFNDLEKINPVLIDNCNPF